MTEGSLSEGSLTEGLRGKLTAQRLDSLGPARAAEVAQALLDQLPGDVTWDLCGGSAWLRQRPHDALLIDLSVPPDALEEALAEVEGRARALGTPRLMVNAFASETDLADALVPRGYTLSSTQMCLDLMGPPPSSLLELRPMTEASFATFRERSIAEYAEAKVMAGQAGSFETAFRAARDEFEEQLAEGPATPDMLLYNVFQGSDPIGELWVELMGTRAFVLEIWLRESVRGHGLGRATMHACGAAAWARGCTRVALSVFGNNVSARSLYDSLGYRALEDLRYLDL